MSHSSSLLLGLFTLTGLAACNAQLLSPEGRNDAANAYYGDADTDTDTDTDADTDTDTDSDTDSDTEPECPPMEGCSLEVLDGDFDLLADAALNGGATAPGCPTATWEVRIEGPAAGESCEGDDCKFVLTMSFDSQMSAQGVADWSARYGATDGAGNPCSSTYNNTTNAYISDFDRMTGQNGGTNHDADGDGIGDEGGWCDGAPMPCEYDGDFVQTNSPQGTQGTLTCTCEVPITCEDGNCTGGDDGAPTEVVLDFEDGGDHRRFTWSPWVWVDGGDDCCGMSYVHADVNTVEYSRSAGTPGEVTFDPSTGTWK